MKGRKLFMVFYRVMFPDGSSTGKVNSIITVILFVHLHYSRHADTPKPRQKHTKYSNSVMFYWVWDRVKSIVDTIIIGA